jgi:pseudouridine-5'-phosphate glycosidase
MVKAMSVWFDLLPNLTGRYRVGESWLQILDIPKTLEFLETQGVTVASYQADDFPAFFTRSSGIRSPRRIDSISQYAPHTLLCAMCHQLLF